MGQVERVSPQAIRHAIQSGNALLVCAYEDEEKCRKMNLEGSITLQEFRSRMPSLPKEKEIVLYCA
jgi:hypothetical protein